MAVTRPAVTEPGRRTSVAAKGAGATRGDGGETTFALLAARATACGDTPGKPEATKAAVLSTAT
jgi:hypothetical protein